MYGVTLVENTFVYLNFYTRNSLLSSPHSHLINLKISSILPSSQGIPITIFVGLDMNTNKERLVSVVWNPDTSSFIGDRNTTIQYKDNSCDLNDTKDY